MTDIRRAFLSASVGRYLVMAVNLAATVAMARLLAPDEYGIAVLGAAVLGLAEAIRGLGGGAYLVQAQDLGPDHIRATVTVNLAVTLVLAAALVLLSAPMTRYFQTPDLGRYLPVAAVGFLAGPVVHPVAALLSRQLAFGVLALIGVATALVNAALGVGLALLGFSYMSFAWAGVGAAAAGLLLSLLAWRDRSIFRPGLRGCRGVVAFGAYDGATAVLSQIAESLPYLIFGRLLNAEAVGLAQRAVMLCLFPERVVLSGVGAVALPAFARQRRDGGDLAAPYLRAVELITAALWPALLLLALLAGPVVAVLFGAQWRATVPLIEILAVALLFSFPATLHYPTLVAAGAIRSMPPVVALQGVLSLGILFFAARHGLYPAVLSMLLIVPLNSLIAVAVVRRVAGIRWGDVAAATRRSAVCALLSAAGPLAVAIVTGRLAEMPVAAGLVAVVLAGGGWAGGLWLTHHPLLDELRRLGAALARRRPWRRAGRRGD